MRRKLASPYNLCHIPPRLGWGGFDPCKLIHIYLGALSRTAWTAAGQSRDLLPGASEEGTASCAHSRSGSPDVRRLILEGWIHWSVSHNIATRKGAPQDMSQFCHVAYGVLARTFPISVLTITQLRDRSKDGSPPPPRRFSAFGLSEPLLKGDRPPKGLTPPPADSGSSPIPAVLGGHECDGPPPDRHRAKNGPGSPCRCWRRPPAWARHARRQPGASLVLDGPTARETGAQVGQKACGKVTANKPRSAQ